MMRRVLDCPGTPTGGKNFIVLPIELYPRVDFDQQVDKQRHEERASQGMAPNDIQGEIGQKDQCDTLGDGQTIRHLRMDLLVAMVRAVNAMEQRNPMEGDVDEKKEGIVEDERHG